ncbi:alpha-(1,3)-fucosyltransferase 10-like [Diadema antillarum]|uniref:alpha-(1,3)-fucosyltransferase 10-like n=1 Tax=Diadema antillarum TaxID=105358 RepID=UPI003A856E02
MAVSKGRITRTLVMVVAILFGLSLIFSLQMQHVGVDEEIIYTGDGPYWMQEQVDYGGKQVAEDGRDEHDVKNVNAAKLHIKHPIIIWWTPFTGERGKVKQCGTDKCFFTVDHHFQHHQNTSAFLFYGTDFKPEDLPLPRKQHHEWGLFHEESPKNNYMLSHPDCLTLFNHTATFKRVSDYPLTTQYLKSIKELESQRFMIPLAEKENAGLAPVVYVHSDCDPPSDRDSYVRELMKHISVDSYGACVHNKDLPKKLTNPLTMEEADFYRIMAKYKFTLAFENAICEDYITEKLWRPLMLGSVPIYRGSPSVRDWLPDEHAAIIVDDFKSPKELAEYIKYVDSHQEEYEKYVNFKRAGATNARLVRRMEEREWGVNDFKKINFIDGFECLVCNRLHENMRAKAAGHSGTSHIARPEHYSCPRPQAFSDRRRNPIALYQGLYDDHVKYAKALRGAVVSNSSYIHKLSEMH